MLLVDKNKLLQLVTAIQYSAKDLANASIFSMSEKIESAKISNDKCWQDLIDYLEEQCERDMEGMADMDEVSEIMKNCICEITEDEPMIICGHYAEEEDKTCFYCGHKKACHAK